MLIGAPTATLIILIILITLISAARLALQTSAVIQNFGADLPQGYARQLDGNDGMLSAWAWRLLMDHVDPMDLMDKMGAPRYTPRVCGAAVEFGSGCRFTVG